MDGGSVTTAGRQTGGTQSERHLLGIYLNDHLAGSTLGLELARRAAASRRVAGSGEVLKRFAAEVADDRTALLSIMATLGVPVRRYKSYAAWLVEKVGRLKPNGHLLDRSPLSSVVELELLRLGVEGKAAGWRTLRVLADRDSRLDKERLNELISRARRQSDTLEELRALAATIAFHMGEDLSGSSA
jgi:hypothetical protein